MSDPFDSMLSGRGKPDRRRSQAPDKPKRRLGRPVTVHPAPPLAGPDLVKNAPVVEVPSTTPDDVAPDVPTIAAPKTRRRLRLRRAQSPDAAVRHADRAAQRRAKVEFRASVGGSRMWQIVVRWIVGLLALLLIVVGLVQVISPKSAEVSDTDVAAIVDQQLAGDGFPTAAAGTFAVRFAGVYYGWSQDAPRAERLQALAAYLPASVADGWDGRGVQTIAAGPYLAGDVTSSDAQNGTVSLALQTDSGTWLYPQVPVYTDGAGGLVIAGVPALAAAPGIADFPGNPGDLDSAIDDTQQQAVSEVLGGFFRAWAASDTAALDRYLTPDAGRAARTGLGAAVEFRTLQSVAVGEQVEGQETRRAIAQVIWQTGDVGEPDASGLTQAYLVTIRQVGGLWSVQDITQGTDVLEAADAGGQAGVETTIGATGVPATTGPTITPGTPTGSEQPTESGTSPKTSAPKKSAAPSSAAPKTSAPKTSAPKASAAPKTSAPKKSTPKKSTPAPKTSSSR